MSKKFFFSSLEQEMFRHGLWGRSSRQLKQELNDHLQCEMETLIEQGRPPQDAEAMALVKLGTPEAIAQTASQELRRSTWFGRHLGWGGVTLFVALILLIALSFVGGLWLSGAFQSNRSSINVTMLYLMQYFYNDGLRFLSFGIILWLSWRSPWGWRPSLVIALVLGLATNLLYLEITPPQGGQAGAFTPAVRSVWVMVIFPLMCLFMGTEQAHLYGRFTWGQGADWFRLLAPLALPFVVRSFQNPTWRRFFTREEIRSR
jgi:hypothetical protein